eukprot:TRINITY_DN10561_c1_g1_i2.p1 TRINITY_DN10561_c1_g1~~TRINITY_DN10561_c1_g1_i2.p1  ORF type:complete len:147 (-),score=32.49 TRINITY_DN10561_c1_g1_i2:365-805(-)
MEVLSLLIGASTSNEHKQFNEVQRVYDMINIKAYVLGDDATGKTSLLIKRATNEFPDEPVPTVFDNYCENVSLPEGNMVCLGFWDSTAAEDYPKYRPLGYPGQTFSFYVIPSLHRNLSSTFEIAGCLKSRNMFLELLLSLLATRLI